MHAARQAPVSRRILAVSWAMPPTLAPQAIVVPRVLRALTELGWQLTVLHADGPTMERCLIRDEGLEVISRGDYSRIVVKPPHLLRLLHHPLPYWLLHRCRLQDPLWKRWAVRTSRHLHDCEGFAGVITFAQPWVDHLVGLEIRRQARLPWVAHFSDPWVDNPYLNVDAPTRALWSRQERAVMEAADAIIFTTREAADLVMCKYPDRCRRKVHIVPYGFDGSLRRHLKPARKNACFRIVYTGSFYGPRKPLTLLESLATLNRKGNLHGQVKVLFVGHSERPYARLATDLGLTSVVAFRSAVSYMESLQIAAEADLLLLIDSPSDGISVFLPSKIVDYLMLNKPILGITPLQGSSAALLRRAECPVVAPGDVPGLSDAIQALLERWRAGQLQVTPAYRKVAAEYDILEVARTFDAIIQKVFIGHKPGACGGRHWSHPSSDTPHKTEW